MTDETPKPAILDSLDDLVYRGTTTLAAIQLDLFTPLKDGPLSEDQIAGAIGVEAVKLRPLLYALVVVGLLEEEGGLFSNSPEADYYLVRGRPSYQGHRQYFWADIWGVALQIGESIRTGKPLAKHDYAAMPEGELEEFMHGLHPWTYDAGIWLTENYDLSSYRSVVDAGGGSGALAIALTDILPHLQATVVEQPEVVPVTRRFVERAGAPKRIRVEALDLIHQPLDGPFAAAFLKALVQTLSVEESHQVLRNIHQALQPGGTIFILDRPLEDSRLEPLDLVLFSPIFTAIYDQGQKRTVQEYRDMLANAGFRDFALDHAGIITARKPG